MSNDIDLTDLYLDDLTEEFEHLDIEDIEWEHRRYVEFGDIDSRNKLVLRAAPLVVALTKRLSIPRDFRNDAIQAGNLAVIQAVDTWNRDRGFRFTTWAAWKAARQMIREVEKLDGNTVPLDLMTLEWLAMMDDHPERIDNVDTLEFAKNVMIQIPVENDDNQDLEAMVMSEQLREAIGRLTEKQKRVLAGVLGGKTFLEVADSLGISKQGAYDVYRRSVDILKNYLTLDLDFSSP